MITYNYCPSDADTHWHTEPHNIASKAGEKLEPSEEAFTELTVTAIVSLVAAGILEILPNRSAKL